MTDSAEQKSSVVISKRLVAVNAASSVGARLLNMFVLVWMYQYLLARIPADEFAIYPVITGIILLAPLVSSFLTTGLARHGTEAYARGDETRVSEILSSILPILAFSGLIFMIGGLCLSWYIDDVLEVPSKLVNDARLMMALLVFRFTLEFVLVPYSMGFHIRQRFVLLNAINIGRDLFRILLLLILLFGVSTRVLWVVVATVAAEGSGILIVAMLSRRMVPALRFRPELFGWKTARWIVSFGIWTTLARFGMSAHNVYVPIVLNKLGTAVDVTAFHVGSMFEKQINMITMIAAAPLEPSLTAMHATDDTARLANAYLRGGRYALWVTLAVATPLAIYSYDIIRLYVGETYLAAALVMILLLARCPLQGGNTLLISMAVARARVKAFSLAAAATQLISLLIMIYLIGWMEMGATGAALAIFFTTTCSNLFVFLPLGLHISGAPLGRFMRETLFLGLTPAILGGAAWMGLRVWHEPSTWIEVGAFCVAGGVVYLLALLGLSLHGDDRRELNTIIGMLKNTLNRFTGSQDATTARQG